MNKYLIALAVGGLMEMPDFTYSDFDVIEANSRNDAISIYNIKHKCSYFYGCCMAEKVDGKINVINNDLSYEKARLLICAIREFEIWAEGYAASGESGTAQMVGKGLGSTFDEAVKDYMSKNPNHGIEENSRNRYITEDAYKNRRSNWSIWACCLFDNESDARKSFG